MIPLTNMKNESKTIAKEIFYKSFADFLSIKKIFWFIFLQKNYGLNKCWSKNIMKKCWSKKFINNCW